MVIDLNDLLHGYNFKGEFDPIKYQKYVDKTIKKYNKHIILIGSNYDFTTNELYKVLTDYKFYINLPIDIVLERYFTSELNNYIECLIQDKKILFKQCSWYKKYIKNFC